MKIEQNKDYQSIIKRHAPRSPLFKNCFLAFLMGGFLCFAGQWLVFLFSYLGADEENSYILVTVLYIFLSSLFTALGFFDNIARHFGAGTLVPVTGFSNAVTSCALDSKSEGFIGGVGTKIFTVAGPVILYSVLAGTLYGFIYYFCGMIGKLI